MNGYDYLIKLNNQLNNLKKQTKTLRNENYYNLYSEMLDFCDFFCKLAEQIDGCEEEFSIVFDAKSYYLNDTIELFFSPFVKEKELKITGKLKNKKDRFIINPDASKMKISSDYYISNQFIWEILIMNKQFIYDSFLKQIEFKLKETCLLLEDEIKFYNFLKK